MKKNGRERKGCGRRGRDVVLIPSFLLRRERDVVFIPSGERNECGRAFHPGEEGVAFHPFPLWNELHSIPSRSGTSCIPSLPSWKGWKSEAMHSFWAFHLFRYFFHSFWKKHFSAKGYRTICSLVCRNSSKEPIGINTYIFSDCFASHKNRILYVLFWNLDGVIHESKIH